jgi:metacaspase-1
MNKGLFVGINSYPLFPLFPLYGCVNDINDLADFVIKKCDFSCNDIKLLCDGVAKKNDITDGIHWLLQGLQAGDRVLFHYSGHGALVPRFNHLGKAIKLYHAICPVDFDWKTTKAITDDDFKKMFLPVPQGVEFIWVVDCCFSGKLIEGTMHSNMRPKTIPPPADIGSRLEEALRNGIQPMGFPGAITNLNIALMAACQGDQLSHDHQFGNKYNGVFTHYLLQEMGKANGLEEPLTTVISDVCGSIAKDGYKQVPQLEGAYSIITKGFLSL